MNVYDEFGATLRLEDAWRAGGEGTIHRITGSAGIAKLYHRQRLTDELRRKLEVMTAHPPEDPTWRASGHRSIAWAQRLIYREPGRRGFCGFVMPAVDTTTFRQAHVYYDPEDRIRRYGGAFTWRHLLTAAHNLASAVAAVHADGHRVGDLRETNLLVAPTALVTLIDCDSFQVRDPETGCVFPTRVGSGEYLPPELQGVDFRSCDPDRYHADLFALAVLIFRFLMLGAHPFQARGPGVSDAPSTEAKIRLGVFPYVRGARGVEPPEYAPPFDALPAGVRRLFVRAFVDGGADPSARPTARDWMGALGGEARALRQCASNANHWYAGSRMRVGRSCPWCGLAREGIDPFPGSFGVGLQVALRASPEPPSAAEREEHLRGYVRVALADGALTRREADYLRGVGDMLGLKRTEIDRVIDDEVRAQTRTPIRVAAPPVAAASGRLWARGHRRALGALRVRASGALGVGSFRRGWRSGRWRSVVPLAGGALVSGTLAPVLAPVLMALVVLPAVVTWGQTPQRAPMRARLAVAPRFVLNVHHAVAHLARVALPSLVVLGAGYAASVRLGHAAAGARAAAAVICLGATAYMLFVMTRTSGEAFVEGAKAGRDALLASLQGYSGRTTRGGKFAWAALASAAIGLRWVPPLWWPLNGPPFSG